MLVFKTIIYHFVHASWPKACPYSLCHSYQCNKITTFKSFHKFIGESSNYLIHNKSTANWSNPLEMEIFLSFWDVFLIKLSICLFMCSMVLSTVISYTQFKNLYKFYSKIGHLNSMLKNWEIIWNRLWLNSILKKHAKLTESSNEGF